LLLTPGFFTDAVGFLLLTPAFRIAAFGWIKSRIKVQSFTMGNQTHPDDDIVEAEFQDVTPNQDSPWNSKNISKD